MDPAPSGLHEVKGLESLENGVGEVVTAATEKGALPFAANAPAKGALFSGRHSSWRRWPRRATCCGVPNATNHSSICFR